MMNKNPTIRIKAASGGVTSAKGFRAGGVAAGVRYEGRPDLGVISSDRPCVSAAVFTTNVVQAAPLTVTREAVNTGDVRAVVVNSGNANAATGDQGLRNARRMQELMAELLGLGAREVAVASTGVVGEPLPMEKVEAGLREAVRSLGPHGEEFAKAILTTDTRVKERAVRMELNGAAVTVGGAAKGSGMIHPNMATMLAFVTTDAAVEKNCLQEALRRVTERTFNRITVDGDTSPNDMALVLANGAAGNETITAGSAELAVFEAALEDVMRGLAKEISRGGEGATKLVTVAVEDAADEASAAKLAKMVVGSNLVKAAVFGEDANWGRVLVAMGYAGVPFDPAGVSIEFGNVTVFADGEPISHDPEAANAALAGDEVVITVRMGEGGASAEAWGCDLTYEYVKINGSYRT